MESTQYLSIRCSERLADVGIAPSVGRRGDASDNALAETLIGLLMTNVIHQAGPWRSLDDVEYVTLAWVAVQHDPTVGTDAISSPTGI